MSRSQARGRSGTGRRTAREKQSNLFHGRWGREGKGAGLSGSSPDSCPVTAVTQPCRCAAHFNQHSKKERPKKKKEEKESPIQIPLKKPLFLLR